MSLIRMRDVILHPGALRKTILLLVVVGALVAGLLAMHTVASSMAGHNDTSVSAMAMPGPTHHADAITAPDRGSVQLTDCVGVCDPGHAMATTVCVLALLITALMLAAQRPPAESYLLRVTMPIVRRFVASAAAAFAPPPSLDALSIGRT